MDADHVVEAFVIDSQKAQDLLRWFEAAAAMLRRERDNAIVASVPSRGDRYL